MTDSPVRRLKRCRFPCCDSAYTVFGSLGSTRVWKPSPPAVTNQSELRIPLSDLVRELYDYADNPETLAGTPRVVQTWARRPPPVP